MNVHSATQAAAGHNVASWFGSAIHATLPHTSASLDFLSIMTVVVAGIDAYIHQRLTGKRWPPEQFIRVGFAAAPLPVYACLPCLPFDNDLATMFEDERLLMALAAASGFMWTLREIRALFREERSVKPKPEGPSATPL